MKIHHATAKRANEAGFAIDEHNDEEAILTNADMGISLIGDEPKWLVDAIPALRMGVVEYGFAYEQAGVDDGDYSVQCTFDGEPMGEAVSIEDLETGVMLAAQAKAEAGIEDEADEEEKGSSVVPDVYKRRYAEAGHPNTCGDWLATELNKICLTTEGFQIAPMLAICDANGVDGDRYTRKQSIGWQGRFRMSARNKMKGLVAVAGFLRIPEGVDADGEREIPAPDEWRSANMPKAKGKAALAKAA